MDNVIIGSPDTVTKKLSRIIERLNPGYPHIYGNGGGMAHEDVMRPGELLGNEVIPALHEIQLQPYEQERWRRAATVLVIPMEIGTRESLGMK